jgi:anaerobic selenocysteine-containing dehydrogenase
MTNHWTDIGNASTVLVWGANPSENHPACMAHINRARNRGAKLVVVDPRRTRTALQADQYVRIRPGTDIALVNGVVREIISQMEGTSSNRTLDPGVVSKFYQYLNQSGNGSFYTDGDATHASSLSTTVAGSSKYTDARFLVNAAGTDYVRTTVTASGGTPVGGETANQLISNFPVKVADCTADENTVYNRLKAHVAPYTLDVVSGIVGCTQQEIIDLAQHFVDNSRCSNPVPTLGPQDPTLPGYKCINMLYAMGITQHTTGSQNVKSFALIQTLMGNMGRAGGGIDALRGIHNVQGSTDMGLLNGNIPGYSSNPAVGSTFGEYMDGLWGIPLSGTTGTTDFSGTPRSLMDGSYDDAYNPGAMGLQQRGFYNMSLKFFGGFAEATAATTLSARKTIVDGIFDLWPKGNGDSHMSMFRAMIAGTTKALLSWGQNPAVTEPNQGKIRAGLKNLDLLVVTDLFETETAACDRKDGSITYLIPTCSHVEHAGSATNSGRTLQWRYRATTPKGNSKDDIELLLRLAYALEGAGAFSHIATKWASIGITGGVYDKLYGTPYGWSPASGAFESASLAGVEFAVLPSPTSPAPTYEARTATGAEAVAELIYREMNIPTTGAGAGTFWIYTGAYDTNHTTNKGGGTQPQTDWGVSNRAKSRDTTNYNGTFAFHGWGYAWLVNRRVFYNNSDIPGDVGDFFMDPDSCSKLFVPTNSALTNYSRWYRHYHGLVDKPDVVVAGDTTSPHFVPKPRPQERLLQRRGVATPRAELRMS